MTDIDTAKLRELLEALPQGQRAAHYVHGYGFSFHTSLDGPATPATAYACAAYNAVPALCDALDAAQARVRELEDRIERAMAYAAGRWSEWGGRAVVVADILRGECGECGVKIDGYHDCEALEPDDGE